MQPIRRIAIFFIDHGDKLWIASIAAVLLLPATGADLPGWLIACAVLPLLLLPLTLLML